MSLVAYQQGFTMSVSGGGSMASLWLCLLPPSFQFSFPHLALLYPITDLRQFFLFINGNHSVQRIPHQLYIPTGVYSGGEPWFVELWDHCLLNSPVNSVKILWSHSLPPSHSGIHPKIPQQCINHWAIVRWPSPYCGALVWKYSLKETLVLIVKST